MSTLYPSISIVTPSYNQGQYIEQTICSVLNQNYPNLEYVIIDGGSTDNSVDIIRKYEKHLKYWVTEKDKGQANAINKGLSYCTGEIFNWLNSDDYFEDGALMKIAAAFNSPAVQAVAGRVNNFSSLHSEIVSNQNLSASGLMCWKRNVHFVQPGVWLKRQYILECLGIDEQFHYAFDWDLLIRYLYLYPNVFYLDDVLVNFRLHEQSKTISAIDRFAAEESKIIEKLVATDKFSLLRIEGNHKIQRAAWSSFLNEIKSDNSRNRIVKLARVISNLKQQPLDWRVFRMTLGSLKNIIINS